MLNQYEGSAVAESNEGIGALAADNAAEQQPSLPDEMSTAQMLYSVVAHNVANPDKRIALSPEQGKEIMRDFVDFVAGSNEPPTTEDGRIKTFGEMDDNELLKCLNALNKDPQVMLGTRTQEELFKADKAAKASLDNEQTKVIDAVSERAELLKRQKEMGQLSADEQTRLAALNKDASVMAVQSFITANAKTESAPVADATPDKSYVLSSSTHKGADGYEIFSSAPHVKEAFVAASVETNQGEEPSVANKRGIDQANNNRPVITAAKVDATANAFM